MEYLTYKQRKQKSFDLDKTSPKNNNGITKKKKQKFIKF